MKNKEFVKSFYPDAYLKTLHSKRGLTSFCVNTNSALLTIGWPNPKIAWQRAARIIQIDMIWKLEQR